LLLSRIPRGAFVAIPTGRPRAPRSSSERTSVAAPRRRSAVISPKRCAAFPSVRTLGVAFAAWAHGVTTVVAAKWGTGPAIVAPERGARTRIVESPRWAIVGASSLARHVAVAEARTPNRTVNRWAFARDAHFGGARWLRRYGDENHELAGASVLDRRVDVRRDQDSVHLLQLFALTAGADVGGSFDD
jgi:hypothetical protein